MQAKNVNLPLDEPNLVSIDPSGSEEQDHGTFEFDGASYKLDESGNALDDAGQVKYTPQQLEELKNKPADPPKDDDDDPNVSNIDIDGVVYKLDKDGNAVEDNGAVKYTAEQLKEFEDTASKDDDVDYISEIQKRVNIQILNEDGKPVTYENSVEGLAKYASDVKEYAEAEASKTIIGDLFSRYPGLEDAYYYARANNGSLEGFAPSADYSTIKVSDDDVEQHKALIYAERIAKGDTKSQAERAVRYAIEDKTTKADAEESLNFLRGKTEQEKNAKKRFFENQEKAEQESNDRYTKAVADTIDSKKVVIGGEEIILPAVFRVNNSGKIEQKTLKDFKAYMFEPRKFKIGDEEVVLTPNQYEAYVENSRKDHNNEVYDALRRFLKYDDSQLIKGAMAGEKAKAIRKLVTTSKSKASANVDRKDGKLKLPI